MYTRCNFWIDGKIALVLEIFVRFLDKLFFVCFSFSSQEKKKLLQRFVSEYFSKKIFSSNLLVQTRVQRTQYIIMDMLRRLLSPSLCVAVVVSFTYVLLLGIALLLLLLLLLRLRIRLTLM